MKLHLSYSKDILTESKDSLPEYIEQGGNENIENVLLYLFTQTQLILFTDDYPLHKVLKNIKKSQPVSNHNVPNHSNEYYNTSRSDIMNKTMNRSNNPYSSATEDQIASIMKEYSQMGWGNTKIQSQMIMLNLIFQILMINIILIIQDKDLWRKEKWSPRTDKV